MSYDNFPENFWDKINEKVKELIGKHHRPSSEIILDDVDLREMLKISRRTALCYRQSKGLVYFKIENKIFYFLSDVLNFVKSYGKTEE